MGQKIFSHRLEIDYLLNNLASTQTTRNQKPAGQTTLGVEGYLC